MLPVATKLLTVGFCDLAGGNNDMAHHVKYLVCRLETSLSHHVGDGPDDGAFDFHINPPTSGVFFLLGVTCSLLHLNLINAVSVMDMHSHQTGDHGVGPQTFQGLQQLRVPYFVMGNEGQGGNLAGVFGVEILNVGESTVDLPTKIFSIGPVKTEDGDIIDCFPPHLGRFDTIDLALWDTAKEQDHGNG